MADAYFPYDVQPDLRRLGFGYSLIPTRLGPLRVARSSADAPVDTVFLHGVGLDSSAWSPLLEAAHGDERTRGWAFLDLPGFGGSAALERSVTLDEACAAVLDAVTALGAETVHVVGHSMGGFLALHLTASHAERVRSLTVVCGAYGTIVDVVNAPLRTLLQAPATAIRYLGLTAVARLGRLGALGLRFAARTRLMRLSLAGLAAHPFRVPGSMLVAIADGNRPRSFLYARDTGVGYDCRAVWGRIAVPVLAVYGTADSLVSKRDADVLAEAAPEARTEYVDQAAHLVPMEQPAALLRLVLSARDRPA